MVGLGWHEGVIGSWLMFLLASIELRAPFQRLCREIPAIFDSVDAKRRRILEKKLAKHEHDATQHCEDIRTMFEEMIVPVTIED